MVSRDFEVIAKALASVRPMSWADPLVSQSISAKQWWLCVHALSEHLANTNPNYVHSRFVAACTR